MFPYEADALARSIAEDRMREVTHRRLVREIKGRDQHPATPAAAGEPQRHGAIWGLLHLRHAYS
jgi:hypothetical protein